MALPQPDTPKPNAQAHASPGDPPSPRNKESAGTRSGPGQCGHLGGDQESKWPLFCSLPTQREESAALFLQHHESLEPSIQMCAEPGPGYF